ncbi:cyclic AMP-responsive element-binding protein 3 [Aquila chrysaetos chrysaetos]|uniref:cyclic AMP-responsive element-binding protein 3 n=1 Tax=Aquila chrysaetos chrysaetos TaxID=223781 RepID=UPI001176F4DE|nr:cyclic AMP-responsive element-binding protein 3 [Aquila chrysaetos chrysaetos]
MEQGHLSELLPEDDTLHQASDDCSEMSSSKDLPALISEELLDFLLKDDVPGPELPQVENNLMQDWNMLEDKDLDKEIDDFFSSLMTSSADEPGTLLDCLPANSDSGTSEGQLPSCSPNSNLASSSWSSAVVYTDHNYSIRVHWPMQESTMSGKAQGGASVDLGTGMDLEGTSKALEQEQSSSFPGAVDAGPELPQFPKLVLTEEERQLLAKEGVTLPTHKPLNKAQEQLLKKVRQRIRSKHLASDSRRTKRMYVNDLERRLSACTALNQKLEKKVQLLQKQNMSLLKQLQKLRASMKQSRTRTTITTCGTVMVLSLCLMVPPNVHSPESGERKLEISVQTQRIHQVPNQVAPDVQEGAVLEDLSSEPEEPSTSGSFNPSGEEGQSAPNPDPSSSVDSNLSSNPPMAEGSEPGAPQPQEQHVESSPVQTVVVLTWKGEREEESQHAATVIIEHHSPNGM